MYWKFIAYLHNTWRILEGGILSRAELQLRSSGLAAGLKPRADSSPPSPTVSSYSRDLRDTTLEELVVKGDRLLPNRKHLMQEQTPVWGSRQ